MSLAILSLALSARGPFLRLERVDAARCAEEGVVTAAIAELSLEGEMADAAPADYRLIVDGAKLGSPPVKVETFRAGRAPLSVVLVLQANLPYQQDMDAIAAGVRAFLRALPPRAQVSISTYGEGVRRLATDRPPEDAARALEGLTAGDSAESPALDALRTALLDLGDPDPKARRLLIAVSDGLSDGADPDAVRALGNLARAKGVPILPIAFSATDERAPMLALGELAKRSNGTFRFAKSAGDVEGELAHLAQEIDRQLQLDFEIPDRCAARHTLAVSRGTLRSNVRDTPAFEGAGVGSAGWIGLAALAAISAAFFVVRGRARSRAG